VGEAALSRLGSLRLTEITPDVIESFVLDLRGDGVGEGTISKCLVVLQGMMKKAVAWRRLASNPVASISRRRHTPTRTVRPLAPASVEAMRRRIGHRDATLISVLAYAGLRPGEALGLRWGDIRDRTILVERAVSLGELKSTKTRRARAVRMVSPLVADLARWRIACGRPDDETLVFPRSDGRPWTEQDWRNWGRRVFRPAAEAIGLTNVRPYDLRHSFCSLLLAEGRSVMEVASQAGHSPTMTLSTYGHVLDELQGGSTVTAEDEIRIARDGGRPGCMPDLDLFSETNDP
jgi:integrase